MKRADDVFDTAEIDGGLAADGGIHLRKQCRRNVVKIDTAHKGSGSKACEIADNATTDRHDGIGTGESVFEHHTAELFKGRKAFAVFALCDDGFHGVLALCANDIGVFTRNAVIGDDEYLSIQIQVF